MSEPKTIQERPLAINDDKKSLDELTKALQDLTEFEKLSRDANYVVGGKPLPKMNDDKNRDWFDEAARSWLCSTLPSIVVNDPALLDKRTAELANHFRSHIPPQPPIAENVKELAQKICDNRASRVEELLQSFLTAHSAEQNKETIRVLGQALACLETYQGIYTGSADGNKQALTTHLQKLKGEGKLVMNFNETQTKTKAVCMD